MLSLNLLIIVYRGADLYSRSSLGGKEPVNNQNNPGLLADDYNDASL